MRERREALAPEQVGIASSRGRRTPGLRREEVAFLADIGVKWYARLEAGDDIHPSTAALTGIAMALRLSTAELEYVLELAASRRPSAEPSEEGPMPAPLEQLLGRTSGIAISVGDRILTPLQWNATADAIYGYSRFEDPIDRNSLIRALFDPDFIVFLGEERVKLISTAVGMFRLNCASQSPSPFATAVFERAKEHPLFQAAWKQRVVASELSQEQAMVRVHPLVGHLDMFAIDFNSTMFTGFARIMIPANDATAEKFGRLERLGQSKIYGKASATSRT